MGRESDQTNRRVYGSPEVASVLVRREGYTCPEEARMMARLASEIQGQPILDIGVGGGRTTPILRSMSADYIGIDNVGSLVAAARRRQPEARFEEMDARDLSAFERGRFGLVVFSFNGLDSVAHADRHTVLAEIQRVLRPGGLFAYSTQNLDYRLAGRTLAHRDWRRALSHPVRAVRYTVRLPTLTRERRRLAALAERGNGWATSASLAYGHATLWHQVTLAHAWEELRGAGFTGDVEVYGPADFQARLLPGDDAGRRLASRLDTRQWSSLHLVARRPHGT